MKNLISKIVRRKELKESMNIKIDNPIPNIKVSLNKNPDGSFSVVLTQPGAIETKVLSSIEPGGIAKIGSREYIVLEQDGDTTAVIAKEFVKKMTFGNDGDYTKSGIRKYLNGEFYEEVAAAIGVDNIIEHTVDLMADDGTGKGVSCKDKISLLTTDRYRKYRKFLPAYGSWWWLATQVSAAINDYARCVCCVRSSGPLYWGGCGRCGGVRPFLILKSSISVS